jgi:hypothetical protein
MIKFLLQENIHATLTFLQASFTQIQLTESRVSPADLVKLNSKNTSEKALSSAT